MIIGNTEDEYEWEEILFISDDNNCAVIKVQQVYEDSHWYELRLKNSSMSKKEVDGKCLRDFTSRVDKLKIVYETTCQEILKRKESILFLGLSRSIPIDLRIQISI
ncbi:uncharacterized protein LOC144135106 [Amblyomma americanum]